MSKFNLISDLNKGIRLFDYDLSNQEYRKLEDLYNDNKDGVHIIRMFYTNKKSKFGDNEVVVTDNFIINLPKHLTETVDKIKGNSEYVKLINEGKMVFTIYEYEYGQGRKAYSINIGTL